MCLLIFVAYENRPFLAHSVQAICFHPACCSFRRCFTAHHFVFQDSLGSVCARKHAKLHVAPTCRWIVYKTKLACLHSVYFGTIVPSEKGNMGCL